MRQSSQLSGTASEFLVLSVLYRLGIDAFISFGNTKQIDIIIKGKNGSALTVDVKSVRGYSSIPVNNVKDAKNHFVIVVPYDNKFSTPTYLPDFYIIPADEIPTLRKTFGDQLRLMKGALLKYKDNWKPLQI